MFILLMETPLKYLHSFALLLTLGFLTGCGGGDLPVVTTDPEAIRKEQERLRNEIPATKIDPVKAEQDRLKKMQGGSRP
jgi:hypothetical protein